MFFTDPKTKKVTRFDGVVASKIGDVLFFVFCRKGADPVTSLDCVNARKAYRAAKKRGLSELDGSDRADRFFMGDFRK